MHPRISAIIPAYNPGSLIEETIRSIQAQTVPVYEIIVVDDGSTDDTAERVQQRWPDIRYIYQENAGDGAARAQGIKLARGELLAFLDADDLWTPTKLETQLAYLERDPQLQIVLGHLQRFWIDANGNKHFLKPELAMSSIAVLVRRQVFEMVSLEGWPDMAADFDWLMKARELGLPLIVHQETVAFYRRHGLNRTNFLGDQTLGSSVLKVLKRSVDRRRKNNIGELAKLQESVDDNEAKTSD